ncbi:unnamed protein product [Amoebophrya sp. A120]|nr:unnamed protein product [Amoebophrya sp. A120]|eukprot:GSA120T00009512001.1
MPPPSSVGADAGRTGRSRSPRRHPQRVEDLFQDDSTLQMGGLAGIWKVKNDEMDDEVPSMVWVDTDGQSMRFFKQDKWKMARGAGSQKNTIFSVKAKIANRMWVANGVRADAESITWQNEADADEKATWIRSKEHALPSCSGASSRQVPGNGAEINRPIVSADMIDDGIDRTIAQAEEAFQETTKAFQETTRAALEKLRNGLQSAKKCEVVPSCKICLTRPVSVVLLGCGHTLCNDCADIQCKPGKVCFACKVPYAGRQQMFFS